MLGLEGTAAWGSAEKMTNNETRPMTIQGMMNHNLRVEQQRVPGGLGRPGAPQKVSCLVSPK